MAEMVVQAYSLSSLQAKVGELKILGQLGIFSLHSEILPQKQNKREQNHSQKHSLHWS